MRILHIYKSYYPETVGGCESFIDNLTKQTAELGCENTLLTTAKIPDKTEEQQPHLKIIRYPQTIAMASTPFSWQLFKDFSRIAEPYDLLHFHFPWPFADLIQQWSNIKKPILVTYQSDIVKQKKLLYLYKPLMKRFLNRADRIIASTQNYVDSSEQLTPYRNKTQVIPLGISEEPLQNISNDIVGSYQQQFGQKFLLYLGVLRYYKGVQYLLDAVKHLTIPVVIAGTGPEEQQLKQQAKKLNLNHVIFLGRVTDQEKAVLLHSCYALVLPSIYRSEAYGISLLEAMICGKPLISTELKTGTSFINQHQHTGLVVEPKDAEQLKNAIHYLFANPAEAKRMGENSRKRYEDLFTAQQTAKQYHQVYRELLNSTIAKL